MRVAAMLCAMYGASFCCSSGVTTSRCSPAAAPPPPIQISRYTPAAAATGHRLPANAE